jgi:outer membrane protein assembly factor BamB
MYCLTADKGEMVWQHLVRAPIWGTAPVVDGRVVFGDKSGWMYMLSARTGERLWELQIGENINATPAVLDGHIYIGAFNGKLFALGPSKAEPQPLTTDKEPEVKQ